MLDTDEYSLRDQFHKAFSKQWGGCKFSRLERARLVNTLAAKLAAHFKTIGPPKTQDELNSYINEALNKYG